MDIERIKEYLTDCKDENGVINEDKVVELLSWTYEQGWVDGRDDIIERQNDY